MPQTVSSLPATTDLPTLFEEQRGVLQGLSPSSWAAHALLQLPLTMGDPEKTFQRIPETLLYPLSADALPSPVRLVVVDLGKRAYKIVCLNQHSQFVSAILPDAYAPLSGMVQHEGEDLSETEAAACYAYQVYEGEADTTEANTSSERFEMGKNALRSADLLPTNEDSKVRLRDSRVRNMLFAGLAEQFACMELSQGVIHQIVLCLGVPPRDLETERAAETKQAAATLKGTVRVEQENLRTGETVVWTITILGVYVEAQSKGTFYAVAKQLDGSPALAQKIFKIYDVGGGDTNIAEISAEGTIMAKGERKGFGTVEVALALKKLAEARYSLELTEIAAQEALHSKKIWRSGLEQDISALIEELRPRFAQILARIAVSREALTTFIIFTGGGSALLTEEIIKMMKDKNLQLGSDYFIIPTELAVLCNAVGLYALCYYKIQALIKKTILEYCELGEQLLAAQKELKEVQALQPSDQRRESALARRVQQLHVQHSNHVGHAYPAGYVRQINAQRKATAVRPTPSKKK